jgi:hypothetical protein
VVGGSIIFFVLWDTQKVKKSNISCIFGKYIFGSCLNFLCSPNYNVFEHDFMHFYKINSWFHRTFFLFELIKSHFFRKKIRITSVESQKSPLDCVLLSYFACSVVRWAI